MLVCAVGVTHCMYILYTYILCLYVRYICSIYVPNMSAIFTSAILNWPSDPGAILSLFWCLLRFRSWSSSLNYCAWKEISTWKQNLTEGTQKSTVKISKFLPRVLGLLVLELLLLSKKFSVKRAHFYTILEDLRSALFISEWNQLCVLLVFLFLLASPQGI